MEEWKVIRTSETRQVLRREISNFGRVKTIYRNNREDIIGFGTLMSIGYRKIGIRKKTIYIHHLVCEYFIGERPLNFDIDHIDRNRENNNISNLRYISKSDNSSNKQKRGDITKIKGGRFRFRYIVNKKRKSKTFKTKIGCELGQKIYIGMVDILELYE